MKTVSDLFLAAQKSTTPGVIYQVFYKRRYWNAPLQQFSWETNWTELSQSKDIKTVSGISWQLDTDQLNEFKVSNVTITVNNHDNKWRFDNAAGIFGRDAGSTLYPYEPFWMKFQIRAGFNLSDGTEEVVTMFTGVAVEYTMDSMSASCQISIHGLEDILSLTPADGIATTVTGETIGTGNGVLTDFTTLNPGVGAVILVSVDGITKINGSDYTVSQINDQSLGAKVHFPTPPTGGQVIRATYYYWPQNQSFQVIVKALLTAGGVPSANQSVQPVVFPNNVINTQTYTTKADFDAGTKDKIDTDTLVDSMRIDWTDASFKESTTWAASMTGWTTVVNSGVPDVTSDGTYITDILKVTPTHITRPSTRKTGVWSLKYKFWDTLNSTMTVYLATTVNGKGFANSSGAYVTLTRTTIESTGFDSGTTEHTLTMVRTGSGIIKIYVDAVLITSKTGPANPDCTHFAIGFEGSPVADQKITVREIYIPTASISGNWISASLNCGSTPTAWGVLNHTEVGGGTMTYQTRSSDDGISWDAFIDLPVSGFPASTLRQYLQVKFIASIDSTTSDEPTCSEVIVRYNTSSTGIILPAFTDMTVYSAIQAMAAFANYEFGFNPDETFFFRSKVAGSSQLDVSEGDYILQISSMTSGYEKVYSTIRVTYGSVIKEIADNGGSPFSPYSKVGRRRYELTADSSIVISPTADVSSGIATTFRQELSNPKRRFKMMTKFLPQIDLSDVLTVSMKVNTPQHPWVFADGEVSLGQEDTRLWGEGEQMVYGMRVKVLGARYDLTKRECEFDCEEVLT